jgi:hypothetical protein
LAVCSFQKNITKHKKINKIGWNLCGIFIYFRNINSKFYCWGFPKYPGALMVKDGWRNGEGEVIAVGRFEYATGSRSFVVRI